MSGPPHAPPAGDGPGRRTRAPTRRALVRALALSGALAPAAPLLAPRRARAQSADERRRALVDRVRVAYGVPGLSVALAADGAVVFTAASGVADAGTMEPVTERSLFRIASCSKPFTAAALMLAASTGRSAPADLDQRVFGEGGVLSGLPGPTMRNGWGEITVRQLMTHTAGCPTNDGRDPMFDGALAALTDEAFIRRTLAARCLNQEDPVDGACPRTGPGERYAYSNFGFYVLGYIIAGATSGCRPDRPSEAGCGYPGAYGRFVQEAVLRPRDIRGMRLARTGIRVPNEVAYYGRGHDDPYGFNITRMAAHGGWIATAHDLALFAATALRDVPPGMARRMATPTPQSSTAGQPYGEGWQLGGSPPYNLWHNGSLPGTTSVMWRQPNGRAYAALSNQRTDRQVDGRGLLGAMDRLGYDLFDV